MGNGDIFERQRLSKDMKVTLVRILDKVKSEPKNLEVSISFQKIYNLIISYLCGSLNIARY